MTVIAIEGLSITLSVGADLGAYLPNARLQSGLAHLMRKLIERIEGLAELPNEGLEPHPRRGRSGRRT